MYPCRLIISKAVNQNYLLVNHLWFEICDIYPMPYLFHIYQWDKQPKKNEKKRDIQNPVHISQFSSLNFHFTEYLSITMYSHFLE